MPNVEVFINAKNKPGNLSDDPGAIVELVRQARIKPVNPDLNKQRGVPLIDTTRSNVPYAWVKYGTSIRRGEARTQQFVAEIVNSDSGYAVRVPVVYLAFQWDDYVFIAMEYIQGSICNDSDVPLVASAIRAMIQIKAPTAEPGPQGGGLIEHPFFVEKTASVTYKSVDLLEQHVNGIFAYKRMKHTVDFKAEVKLQGMRLCPSDMDKSNFLRDTDGNIVAIDFGATCFLPPSFFSFALQVGRPYTQLLTRVINYPRSAQLNGMLAATSVLVPYDTNDIGLPAELRASPQSAERTRRPL